MPPLPDVLSLMFVLLIASSSSAAAREVTNATLRYISGGVAPVLSSQTPGMVPDDGSGIGIEDGSLVVVNGTMHLFPTELSDGWNCTRVVHWTAPLNDRLNWTFVGGITPHGHGRCGVDDHHAELWSGSPQWDETEEGGRWYLSVVGYNMNCNLSARSASGGDGRILLFRSRVAGIAGVAGPYDELEDVLAADGLIPRVGRQDWEDWGAQEGIDPDHTPFPERVVENGICSFSPMYKSAFPGEPQGRRWAFYGSAWDTGQAYSDAGIQGPWVRAPTGNPRPIGNWSDGGPEIPLVFRASTGIYMLIWAANLLQVEHGLAFAWSKDGVNWEDSTGCETRTGRAGCMLPVAPPPHVSFRTPLALVEHEDKPGFFTLFFTAFAKNHADPKRYPDIGGYANMYATEFELELTFSTE